MWLRSPDNHMQNNCDYTTVHPSHVKFQKASESLARNIKKKKKIRAAASWNGEQMEYGCSMYSFFVKSCKEREILPFKSVAFLPPQSHLFIVRYYFKTSGIL